MVEVIIRSEGPGIFRLRVFWVRFNGHSIDRSGSEEGGGGRVCDKSQQHHRRHFMVVTSSIYSVVFQYNISEHIPSCMYIFQ